MKEAEAGGRREARNLGLLTNIGELGSPRDDPVQRGASGVKRTSEMMTRTRVRERQAEAWTR